MEPSGTVEWWNSVVEWLDGRLTTLYSFAASAVTRVINTHAHFGATVTSLVRGRYSYDRLLVPGGAGLRDYLVTVNCGHGVSSSPTLLEIDDSFTSVADRILLKGF